MRKLFLEIAIYLNKVLCGSYTTKEIADNARNYYADYCESKAKGKYVGTMPFVVENLIDLNANEYLSKIKL